MENCIKHIRKEKKVTLLELSNMTELSMGYLSHIENGTRRNPSYKTMKKISNALEKKIDEIFFDENL